MKVLLILAVYILSVVFMYRFFKLAYSKKGRWSNLDFGKGGYFLIFLPYINTISCLVGWFGHHPLRKFY